MVASTSMLALDMLSPEEMDIYIVEQPHSITIAQTPKAPPTTTNSNLKKSTDTSSTNVISNAAAVTLTLNPQNIKLDQSLPLYTPEQSAEDLISNAFNSELVRGVFGEQDINISNIDQSGIRMSIEFHQ